jgi:hypothetical protein
MEDSPSLSGVLKASMISSWALDTECCVPLMVTSLSALLGMFLETVMWAPEISWIRLILAPLLPMTRPTSELDTVICSVLVVLVTACQAGEEVLGGGGGGSGDEVLGGAKLRGVVSVVAALSFWDLILSSSVLHRERAWRCSSSISSVGQSPRDS